MGMELFHKDTMTAEERIQALMEGKPIDRVPLNLQAFAFSAVNVGWSIYDWYTDMQKNFDSGRMTAEQYGAMWLPFGGYPSVGPYELGGEMKWPTSEWDQCPNAEPAAETEDAAWALELPDYEVLKEAGYMPYFREFAKISSSAGLPFCVPMYGPWTTAGNIVGIVNLAKWAYKKPDLAHQMVRFATDFLLLVQQIIIDEAGAPQGYFPADSTASASNDLISPKTFEEFAFPYIIDYHSGLMEKGIMGIMFHLCGDQTKNYAFYPQVPLPPLSQISISHEVDLELAMETFPDYVIHGNVEPSLIQLGTPEQVYEASRIAIEKGKKHKRGFVLCPGCELPPSSPPYNVWMMSKAINDFGYYT